MFIVVFITMEFKSHSCTFLGWGFLSYHVKVSHIFKSFMLVISCQNHEISVLNSDHKFLCSYRSCIYVNFVKLPNIDKLATPNKPEIVVVKRWKVFCIKQQILMSYLHHFLLRSLTVI